MKRYIYKAEFRAYDRETIHYWEYDEPVDFAIIENRILTICNTAVIKRIVEGCIRRGTVKEQRYKNNKIL